MRAREELDAGAGPCPLLVDGWRTSVLVHAIKPGGEDRAPVGHGAGAVDDDVVAPAAEGMPVRIGECIRRVEPELAGARLILEDGAVGDPHRRPPRRLALRVVERALLEEESAGGVDREAVGGVVGVGGVEASH